MPLTADQKRKAYDAMVRAMEDEGPVTVLKGDIKGALDASSNWLDQNDNGHAGSLPAGFRNGIPPARRQKMERLVMRHVAAVKYG